MTPEQSPGQLTLLNEPSDSVDFRTPCHHQAPFTTIKSYSRNPRPQSYRCNRPAGHAGDHYYSTANLPQTYIWTDDGVVLRGPQCHAP